MITIPDVLSAGQIGARADSRRDILGYPFRERQARPAEVGGIASRVFRHAMRGDYSEATTLPSLRTLVMPCEFITSSSLWTCLVAESETFSPFDPFFVSLGELGKVFIFYFTSTFCTRNFVLSLTTQLKHPQSGIGEPLPSQHAPPPG